MRHKMLFNNLNYEEKQKMFNSIISETLKNLKLMKADQQIILIPYLELL